MIMASRTVFIWAIMAVASSVVFASPSVSDVSYWQNPTSRLVKVTYTLSGESGVPLLDIRTNGISIRTYCTSVRTYDRAVRTYD